MLPLADFMSGRTTTKHVFVSNLLGCKGRDYESDRSTAVRTRRNTRIRVALNFALAACLSNASGVFAQDRSIIGGQVEVMTFELKGREPGSAPTANLFGIPLSRQWQYIGFIESINAQTVTLSLPFWSDNEFNGANGPHYLEILDGPQAGVSVDIVGTLGETGAVVTADDLSGVLLSGEKVRIRLHHTFFSIFGAGNRKGLVGGSQRSQADEVIIFDAGTQTSKIYFHSTSLDAWAEADAPSEAITDFVIYPDQGLFIKRKTEGDRSLVFSGKIREEPVANLLLPGLNILAGVPPKYGDFRESRDSSVVSPGLQRADAVRAKSMTRDTDGNTVIADDGSLTWAQTAGLDSADRIHLVGGAGLIVEHPENAPPETVMLETAVVDGPSGEGETDE